MRRLDRRWAIAALGGILLLLVAGSLFVGAVPLSPKEVLGVLTGGGDPMHRAIVIDVRLGQAVLALVMGAALAGSGVVFQGLFRNPLADPFVVGVSGGAALGAVVAIVTGIEMTGGFGLGAVTLSAFFGALASVAVVWRLAAVRGRIPVTTLLLCGFAIGAFCSAVVSVLMVFHRGNWEEILFWLLGNLNRLDAWHRVGVGLPVVVPALLVIGVFARDLNLMLMGEESAQQLGVEVERTKKILLVAGAVAAAVAVAMCGVIGFVGLIVPHIVRLVVGPDHRRLLPVTVLAGGAFLLVCNLASRVLLPAGGLPVGAVTALAGAPFFLFLLRRRAQRS